MLKKGQTIHLRLPKVTGQPPIDHLERSLRLVVGDHVATSVQPHEGEVAARLDLTNLLAITVNLEVFHLSLLVLLLAGPLKSLSPGLVAEPVADVVGITGVDKNRDFLENTGNNTVERLHPVTTEEEVAIDVEVARFVVANLSADGLHDLLLVQVALNPVKLIVAKAVTAARLANIVDVLASALVGTNHSVIAVDGSRNTAPDGLGVVAVLNQAGAAGQGVVHGAAGTLIENSGPATLTTGHRAVIRVLGETIGKTIANENRLEVDIALLVRQNLRGEDRDVVACVRLARDVEALLRVLGELLEEEGEQGVDVLASGNGVAHRATRV